MKKQILLRGARGNNSPNRSLDCQIQVEHNGGIYFLCAPKITEAMLEMGFMGALKEVMGWLGFDCGRPRLPNLALAAEKRQTLHTKLEAAGFAELAAF